MYPISGWAMLPVGVGLVVIGVTRLVLAASSESIPSTAERVGASASVVLGLFVARGLMLIQPTHAVVLTFFGSYRGTVRVNGLRWTLPLYSRRPISLRLNTLDGAVLKVNDRAGNPVEVSAVVVWRVGDTARAAFAVEDYFEFVSVQSEAAVRDLVMAYRYDADADDEVPGRTLHAADSEVVDALERRLAERLAPSGVVVAEARFNHLAYAPEIAGAMLRRQQAQAIISARASIVSGAVAIALGAVSELRSDGTLEMDPARQAELVGNLLVVLCSETAATPTLPVR